MKTGVFLVIIAVLAALVVTQTIRLEKMRGTARTVSKGSVSGAKPVPQAGRAVYGRGPDSFDEDPFEVMAHMQRQIHRMFEDEFSPSMFGYRATGMPSMQPFYEPNADIKDAKDRYVIQVDLPGMEKDQISVEINGRNLTIFGERRSEDRTEKQGYYRQELSFGQFSRTIRLPDDARADAVTSQYKDGVLSIEIPKKESSLSAPSVKKIPVS